MIVGTLQWAQVHFGRNLMRHACFSRKYATGLQKAALSASGSTSNKGLHDLLTKEEEALMVEQRTLCDRANDIANRTGKVKMRDTPLLEDTLPLDARSNFSIFVAGEFNAGKSSVINALIGHNLLETGALPTTESITLLTHDDTRTTSHLPGGLLWHQVDTMPKGIILVDTPGTNAVIVDHTERTLKLLPTADLIIFCTSADRPFPDSERKLLQSIQAYRKNIIVVINKMDVLDASGGAYGKLEKERVVNFVIENASSLLGGRPVVISISARDALSSKLMNNANLWERSNFQELESFLKKSLTTESKIKAKLLNPLGVAEGVLLKGLEILKDEERALDGDFATLKLLRHQSDSWSKEMQRDAEAFCSEIRDEIEREGTRVSRLLKRVGIVSLIWWSLFDNHRWEAEWKRCMASESIDQVQEKLHERIRDIAEITSSKVQLQGQAVVDYLGKRPSAKSKDIVGSVAVTIQVQHVRDSLKENMCASVRSIMGNHSEFSCKTSVHRSLRYGGVSAALFEGSAFLAFVSSYLGMTDLLYGGMISCASAATGALIVAHTGQIISKKYSTELSILSIDVSDSLEYMYKRSLQNIDRRIIDGVQPYTRYVQTEHDRIQTLIKESEAAVSQAQDIRSRVSKLRHYD